MVNWGDGTSNAYTSAGDVTHVYTDGLNTYTIRVDLADEDGTYIGAGTLAVTVTNVAPTITLSGAANANEGAAYTLTLGAVTDPGSDTVAQYLVNWGDGTSNAYSSAGDVTHIYADGPNNYTIRVDLADEDGTYIGAGTLAVAVTNVPPTIALSGATSVDEGSPFRGSGAFVDPGADSWTATVDYGDGTGVQPLALKSDKTFDLSHTYADDGAYTITVMVVDDDGGNDTETLTVTVSNVALALTVVADQAIDEGSVLSLTDIGTFTDPGFDAPGEPVETFTYSIDWGDGTSDDAGFATIDTPGRLGVPTSGSFDGSHIYSDNGTYTATVTVYDDDGGSDTETFTVTVGNVVPAISGVTGGETVDEGSAFTLADLGWAIEDPGFDNPSNPGGATSETFTSAYTIDWGDGSAVQSGAILGRVSGAAGVPTVAEFEGVAHTYADNGVYTVWITLGDDDSAPVTYALAITVANVAPTVVPATDQTVEEGAVLNVVDLATFTDPGFDNPLRLGGPSVETFHYSIDWGDGMAVDTGVATIDLAGSAGVATAGSFDGSHVYADNGAYTVTLTVIDDDGGTTVATTHVTVLNVDPAVLDFVDNDVNALGQVTVEGSFSDPGFDNPRNPLSPPVGSRESFTVVVDWADGTSDTILLGGPGPFHFTATHTYYAPPDPLNPAADIRIVVTVTDDNGGSEMAETFADVPGEGVQYVYIDTTPVVPHLVFPRATQFDTGDLGAGSTEVFLSSSEYEPARADSSAASENYIVLRTVLPDGSESSDYRMPDNALNILPDILSRLPDNRYRVYEIQSDGPERLVRDVFVRQNRVIDQTDASEGIEERPPQSQSVLPEKVTPEENVSGPGPLTSTWEQWETRHARLPVANEPANDPAEAPGDGSVQEAEPAAVVSDAARAGGPSVLGTVLLAYRLREWREQEAQRTRERFAQWGASPKDGDMYPRKPR